MRLGLGDLRFEQVVLGDEQSHLEADLLGQLGCGDGVLGESLDLRGLRRADGAAAAAAVGVGQAARPFAGRRLSRWGEPQDREGTHAGRIVVRLLELGEADLDEAADPLVDPPELVDQMHRKAAGLAQLSAGEDVADRRLVDHG